MKVAYKIALAGLLAAGAAVAVVRPMVATPQPPAAVVAQAAPAALPAPAPATPAAPLVVGLPDFTRLVDEVAPGVVTVETVVGGGGKAGFDDEAMPGMRGAPQRPRGRGMGTGFVVSADGYVLTNHHVVEGASQVKITLADRRSFTARVIGSDPQSDVAVLKVEARGLPVLRIGQSASLRRGQWVVAIGSPFGLEQSVTAGVVSAVGRANPYSDQRYVPFIQTDVAINRGNSGGPLLNTRGEVVGINSQIFSSSGGYDGVSFAIPIDIAMSAMQQIRTTGHVSRGQIGVQVQAIDDDIARALRLPDNRGALVGEVLPGSAAERAGIEPQDVIRSVNGTPIQQSTDLPPLIGNLPPGARVTLSVVRDGRARDVAVTLGALGEADGGKLGGMNGRDEAPGGAPHQALGLRLQDLAPSDRRQLGLRGDIGVIVVEARGSAAEAGIRRGDVILAIGRQRIGSAAELQLRLRGLEKGDTVMLLVRGRAGTGYVAVIAGDD